MNKITIALIGVIIVAGGVYAYSSNQKGTVLSEQKIGAEEKLMAEEKTAGEKETMVNSDTNNDKMMKGTYEAYTPEKLARAETGDVVLFFHASWCPSCRGLNADIEANTSAIPEGVSILKLDYDKETELKKKYGVTYQHTLVQVDKDGNLIKKWSGSPKLSNLVSEIQ
jgi:thioredoxin 1